MFIRGVWQGERVAVWRAAPPPVLPSRVFLPGTGTSTADRVAGARPHRVPNDGCRPRHLFGGHGRAGGDTAGQSACVAGAAPVDLAVVARTVAVDEPAVTAAGAMLELSSWRWQVNHTDPGPGLCELLAERPDRLAPAQDANWQGTGGTWGNAVVDSIAARERLISHLMAEQYRDVASLAKGYVGIREFLPIELSLALGCTESDAGALVATAEVFTDRLPGTLSALAQGRIDHPKALAMLRGTSGCSDEVAARAEAVVLPGILAAQAPEPEPGGTVEGQLAGSAPVVLTPESVRRRAVRAVIKADPDGAAERHRAAVADRYMSRRPDEDGMARLSMYGTAQQVSAVWEAVTMLAGPRKPGDPRLLGARRVDALTALCTGALMAGPAPQGMRGAGVDPESDPAESDPGGGPDSGSAGGPAAGPDSGPAADPTDDPVAGTPVVAGHRHPRDSRWWRPLVQVTVPLSVLLGADEPCELAGHGPISADQARAIAADGVLRRLVCDPVSGTVLDYGRTRYRPPDSLAELIRARDGSCPLPTCGQPASRNPIDHIEPYHPGQRAGGHTDAANLASPCEHHHRAKDGGGFTLVRDDDGGFTWETPLRRRYRREPHRVWPPPDLIPVGEELDLADGFRPPRPRRTDDGTIYVPHPEPPRPTVRGPAAGARPARGTPDQRPTTDPTSAEPPPF